MNLLFVMASNFRSNKNFNKFLRIFFSLSVIFLLIFSGWPKIQETRAATPVRDFNIQRGCQTPAAGTTAVTLTAGTDYTAPANNSNAFIRLVSTHLSGMGDTVGGGTQEADDWTWYISDPDFAGGSVTFTRAGSTNPQRFCWEIVEYVGIPGGANEMIVRDVDTVTYGSSAVTRNGASVSVSDDTDVAVFITGQSSVETSDQDEVNAGQSTAEWIANTDIPHFTRGFSGNDANHLSYAVVEFTGSNWTVQRVEHTFSSQSPETETITDIGDLSRAFTHAQYRLDREEGLADAGALVWISDTNHVSFDLEDGTDVDAPLNEHHSVAWVISNSETNSATKMNVQHISGQRLKADTSEGANNEEDEWTQAITSVGDLSQASVMGESSISNGGGTAYPRGWISLYLNTVTGVKLYQSDDGQPQHYRFDIAEWPKSVSSFEQSAYRWFNNLNSTDVGSALAAQDTASTLSFPGDAFRLRLTIHIDSAALGLSDENFKLQFAERSGTCDTAFSGETYVDVTSATAIAYNNNSTPADGDNLTDNSNDPVHSGHTTVNQDYEELNNFTNSVAAIPAGSDGLWDFSLIDNSAPENTTYCFRVVKSDNTLLNTYTVIPEITTDLNDIPVASNASIDSDASSISLTEDTTTSVSCTATVTDNDGCTDLTGADYVFYRTSQGNSGTADNNYRYLGSCVQDVGSCTGGGDLTAKYTCIINTQFYADPTDVGSPYSTDDWTCEVIPSDKDGEGTLSADTIEMNSLTALNVTAAIDYGTLALGSDTGATNQTVTVTNTGNRSIDSQISGTAMACTIGSIPVNNQEYATSTFTYGTGTALSGTPTSLVMALPQPTNDADPIVSADSFWGLKMPTLGVSGSCSGTNTFTAIND